MCILQAMEIEGLLQQWGVGEWRSGVLCQHPTGSLRLLLPLLLLLAWVRPTSRDPRLDQSPPCSRAFVLEDVQPCMPYHSKKCVRCGAVEGRWGWGG